MADWVRRAFTSMGLTQVPPGPHAASLKRRLQDGHVILCIDVSGSMQGEPLREVVRGAQRFLDEAVLAEYQVSLVLWAVGVQASTQLSPEAGDALRLLGHAGAGGGNELHSVLQHCDRELRNLEGDRVVAIFGDGDITPREQVLATVAEMKADNVRFVTRGLGANAAAEFALLDSEQADAVAVESVTDLAEGIAGMSKHLHGHKSGGRS
jgi:Mg-chelatase subunit ChlD